MKYSTELLSLQGWV